MDEKPHQKPKIIDSIWTFLVATAFLGPLALPLLWRNPRLKSSTKILGTLFVAGLTLWLILVGKGMIEEIMEQAKELQELQQIQ